MNHAEKIRVLLSKTIDKGCTEEEAMQSAMKARELMEKYSIDFSELEMKAEGARHTRHEDFTNSLEMRILLELYTGIAYFTETIGYQSPVGNEINYVGLSSDTVFADWLTTALQGYTLRATKEYMKSHPKGDIGTTKREKMSFAVGCAARINNRLREAADKNRPPAGTGLVLVKRGLIDAKLAEMDIRLRMGAPVRKLLSKSGLAAGKCAGEGARWDKPVNQGKGVGLLS